jgi:protoporphyrinogen oxidase
MANWGVVGGGLLGMTLAYRLSQHGHRVTLIEAADSLGGLASAWSLGPVLWDRHYHVMLLSDGFLRRLIAELGLEADVRWNESRTGFYSDGRLHSLSSSWDFLRFPLLGPVEKMRLALTILYASRIRSGERLEDELVADWLRRWSGRGVLEKIWLPLLRAKLGPAYARTSAAFIWATISRMYAARRSGLKREMFGYVSGGYARILERFAAVLRQAGVEILLDSPTERIERRDDGLAVGVGRARVRDFDRVVVTVPAPVASRLCAELSPEESAAMARIEYVGIVCASLLLSRPLTPYYITNITDAWVPFTAVIEMSALVDPGEFGGRSLVYLPRYATADDVVWSHSDTEIRDSFVAALQRMHPGLVPEEALAFRVSRIRNVFALPTLGYSQRLPPTTTSVPGLHVVNSAHIVNGTLNVNEVLRLAEKVLPELLAPRQTGSQRQDPAGRSRSA